MMKKKNREQDDKMLNNQDKSTDNNENTQNTDKNVGKEEKESSYEPYKTAKDLNGDESAASVKDDVELKAVEEKLAEMQDKYIRLSAEFDNYRKRTLREKMEMSKYAGEEFFLKIIPFIDDFERGLKHMDTATDSDAVKDGINLIYLKFCDFLKQNGIKEIESLDKMFDLDLHEAIAKIPVEEESKKGKVVDVVLKGYYLQDKVLRFSKVVVGE